MAAAGTPKFHNGMGVAEIRIGAREFECIGALPPFDHPHVYLDMGNDAEMICPYCSTHFRYDESLDRSGAVPAEAAVK